VNRIRGSRTRGFAAAIVGAVLASSGCALLPLTPKEPVTDGALWVQPTPTLGDVTVVDGVAIAYLSQGDDDLQLRGWDAETGRLLWTRDVIPGGGTIGLFLQVRSLTVGDRSYVAALEYLDDWHTIVVVDVRSGERLDYDYPEGLGDPFAFWADGRPEPCADDANAFCVVGYPTYGDEAILFRLDVEDRELREEAGAIPGDARMLDAGIWSTAGRPATGGQEVLGYSVGGDVLWSWPYEEVFGPGYSSDFGWSWAYDSENDQFLSYGGRGELGSLEYDITSTSVVALDRATGRTNWLVRGVDVTCASAFGEPGLRCRYHSGRIVFPDDTSPGEFVDVDVDLEGYDLATGETLWSVPLGDQPGAVTAYETVSFRGGDWRIVPSDDGLLAIDVRDGSVEQIDADEVLPCVRITTYRYTEYSSLGSPLTDYYGTGVVEACTPEGRPVGYDDPPTDFWIRTAGVDAGNGVWIVATTEGLRAYRVGAEVP
jgi:hypothetical protein